MYSTALHAKSLGRDCAAVLVPQHMTAHHQEINDGIRKSCQPIFEIGPTPRQLFGLMKNISLAIARGSLSYMVIPAGGASPAGTLRYVTGVNYSFPLATIILTGTNCYCACAAS